MEKTSSSFIDDETAEKLREFWMPDGEANADNEKKLIEWLTRSGLITGEKTISIATFINQKEYAKQRLKAVEDLKR